MYLKYRIDGQERKVAFGPYPDVSLLKAHQLREATRAKIREGVDPVVTKQVAQKSKNNGSTFRQTTLLWHADHRRGSEHFSSTTLRRQEMYIFSSLGDRAIDQVTTADLLALLRKVESKGILEITARLKNYVVEIMRYTFKRQLIKSNPALDLNGEFSPPEASHYRHSP